MKSLRVFLSAFALFLAAGLTFAGQVKSSETITAYEYIRAAPGIQEECKSIQTNCTLGLPTPCVTVSGNKIGENSMVFSECGQQLTRL